MIKELEISGRQTGKTERLTQKILDVADDYNRIYILAPNVHMMKNFVSLEDDPKISRKITLRTPAQFFDDIRRIRKTNLAIFFDEFDHFLPDFRDGFFDFYMSYSGQVDMYFYTTQRRPRTLKDLNKHFDENNSYFDLLLYLIHMNDNQFKTYTNLNSDFIQRIQSLSTKEQAKNAIGPLLQ